MLFVYCFVALVLIVLVFVALALLSFLLQSRCLSCLGGFAASATVIAVTVPLSLSLSTNSWVPVGHIIDDVLLVAFVLFLLVSVSASLLWRGRFLLDRYVRQRRCWRIHCGYVAVAVFVAAIRAARIGACDRWAHGKLGVSRRDIVFFLVHLVSPCVCFLFALLAYCSCFPCGLRSCMLCASQRRQQRRPTATINNICNERHRNKTATGPGPQQGGKQNPYKSKQQTNNQQTTGQ